MTRAGGWRQSRRRNDRGQVAGIETLAFGVLVFVIGTLIATNAWSIVTTRTSGQAIAREYLRAYTDERSAPDALRAGRRTALLVADRRGVPAGRLTIDDPDRFGPCQMARVRVEIEVPLVRLPLLGEVGQTTVTIESDERIEPYRITTGPGGSESDGGGSCNTG